MDQLHECLDALEHHVHTLPQQTHALARRLRWWRGLAYGLLGLGLLSLLLSSAEVQGEGGGLPALEERVAALEDLLKPFTRVGTEVIITGANLHLVNGLGATETTNALGNLIVGYNELRGQEQDIRTGSHNVVVGEQHNFSRFAGIVVGFRNEISGNFAAVSGGQENVASGLFSAVSGGEFNRASGDHAAVSGGQSNTASGGAAAVSGGNSNTASGVFAVVSGGLFNTASGFVAAVSGGGGFNPGEGNTASGDRAVVSGGFGNTASGPFSVVSGGQNRTAEGEFDWVAGSLVEDGLPVATEQKVA
jgi:hypothetical protein